MQEMLERLRKENEGLELINSSYRKKLQTVQPVHLHEVHNWTYLESAKKLLKEQDHKYLLALILCILILLTLLACFTCCRMSKKGKKKLEKELKSTTNFVQTEEPFVKSKKMDEGRKSYHERFHSNVHLLEVSDIKIESDCHSIAQATKQNISVDIIDAII